MACERCVLTASAALPLDELVEQASGCEGCPLRQGEEVDAAVGGLLARLREAARGLRKAGQRVRKLEADLHEMEEAARRAEEQVAALRNIQKASSREADELLRQKAALLEQKEQALLAMSTPVIAVWEGVLVLPLIGVLDDERARTMALRLLDEVVAARCRSAIIDLTGVPELDAGTARHLLRVASATRLLGARVLLCGMRPEVAHELAALGDLGREIPSTQTLRDALVRCGVGRSR